MEHQKESPKYEENCTKGEYGDEEQRNQEVSPWQV